MPASKISRPTLASALSLSLFCIFCIHTAPAATISVTGVTGLTGTTGASGNPGGAGGPGGNGGDADAILIGSSDADNSVVARGGFGGLGGRGGSGRDIDDPESVAPGGPGGDSGRGGNASAVLEAAVTEGDLDATVRALGGNGTSGGPGGDGIGVPDQTGPSGRASAGGNALASALGTAPGNVHLDLSAGGGWGGDPGPGEPGAPGGAASLGPVLGTSTGGGDVRITASLRGGRGSGPGAAGADILLDNAINGSTTGHLSLYQIAEGGPTQAADAPAGRAASVLSRQGSFGRLQLSVEALGGDGYLSGDALAGAEADNLNGEAFADAVAAGGYARTALPGGRGGDAQANAVANSQGGEWAIANATAIGGTQIDLQGVRSGTGGDGFSSAEAHGTGVGPANAHAEAYGGDGSQAGGNANGIARAVAGAGGAFGDVFVRGGVGTGPSPDGSATARGEIEVRGPITSGWVFSRAAGGSGSAEAEIDIAGGSLVAGRVTVSAPIAGDGSSRVQAWTQARASLARTTYQALPQTLPAYQAAAITEILPGEAVLTAVLAGHGGAEAGLAGADPALLYAALGGGYAPDGNGTAANFASSIALSFDTTDWDAGSRLLLALFEPVAAGDGFDALRFQVLVEGLTVLDESFLDAPTAFSFFDDQVLDLGDWRAGLVGTLDLEFHFLLTASRPGDTFFVNLVAATVPVPPALWLLGSALALMMRLRRRTS